MRSGEIQLVIRQFGLNVMSGLVVFDSSLELPSSESDVSLHIAIY